MSAPEGMSLSLSSSPVSDRLAVGNQQSPDSTFGHETSSPSRTNTNQCISIPCKLKSVRVRKREVPAPKRTPKSKYSCLCGISGWVDYWRYWTRSMVNSFTDDSSARYFFMDARPVRSKFGYTRLRI